MAELTDFIMVKRPDWLQMADLRCTCCNAGFIAVLDRKKFLSESFKCPIDGCIGHLRWDFCGFIPRSVWMNKDNFQFEVNNHNITYTRICFQDKDGIIFGKEKTDGNN